VELAELKPSLSAMLELEGQPNVDWQSVEELSDQTLARLNSEPAPDYPYDTVYHFLDDTDVRQKDERYAQVQRDRLRSWLASGS
jgi:hypothetical protein